MALKKKIKLGDSKLFLASLVKYIQSPKFCGNGPQLGRRLKEREQRLSLDLDLNLDQAGAGHSRWFMKIRAGVFSECSVTGIKM